MYQALYRKYRPKTFDDVFGQDIIIKILKNSIINNKISHAYLFTGPRGTGKTSVAKVFARTINCQKIENATPCNKCNSCNQINNIDIIEIDAASNNGVDEIRELREKVNLVPSISKYKVYIIDEVHMLTIGAFNALLKTLEEPPQHAIFILATTESHKIPATILSRCQRFDFKKISNDKIYEALFKIVKKEKINVNEMAIKEISRLSDGGLRDAISLLDQVIAYSAENVTEEDIHNINGTLTQYQLQQLVQNICDKDLEKILNQLDIYDDKGKNLIKVTEELIQFLKNILIFKNLNNINKETIDKELYVSFINSISNEVLYNIIITLNSAMYEMKKANNPKLILELLFIKIMNFDLQLPQNQEQNNKCVKNTQTKNIKEKTKKIEVTQNKPNYNVDKLKKLKQIRINNTLSNINKKIALELIPQIEKLHEMMFTTSYGEYISTVLDGELKAASKTNLIFVYKSEKIADEFNKNLVKIEEMFKNTFNMEYKIIAVSSDEWKKIKDEYNSKKKKYVEIEEKNLVEEIFKQETIKTNIDNLFGEIVEYN